MKHLRSVSLLILSLVILPFAVNAQVKPAQRFLDTEVHLLLGGSYVTNNYKSVYSEISDLNNSMGFAWGLGMGARFNISSFISLGTELNYLHNTGKMDMAVTADGKPYVSNVFIKNSYSSFNVPVYIRFNFDLANGVRWNVDGGFYLDFGTGGSQKTTTYNASVNDLGQLITDISYQKTGYYDDDKAFLNSYHKFDSGLHIATGLTFVNKITLGLRSQFGLRNAANSEGIVKPSSHNIHLFGTVGYIF
ncbi:MAG: PorT family protein [Duncaniella sp.]|uniref:porin family protein n=1 Tax=Duncaniella sp. TaxID=2518496 RepID=UPI0019A11A42|nr:porin family protein [Duncaniella sp.]MBD5335670.1 PorT family protein [Bacteroides sp.]MDE6089942.1 PorT family protein [Duncaniella sp.]